LNSDGSHHSCDSAVNITRRLGRLNSPCLTTRTLSPVIRQPKGPVFSVAHAASGRSSDPVANGATGQPEPVSHFCFRSLKGFLARCCHIL
jgi:hypothetical protein